MGCIEKCFQNSAGSAVARRSSDSAFHTGGLVYEMHVQWTLCCSSSVRLALVLAMDANNILVQVRLRNSCFSRQTWVKRFSLESSSSACHRFIYFTQFHWFLKIKSRKSLNRCWSIGFYQPTVMNVHTHTHTHTTVLRPS